MDLKLTKQIIRMSRYLLYGIFTQALFASMLLANNGNAQKKSIHDIYINISSKNLKSAIKKIENSTEFTFTYNRAHTDIEKKVFIEQGKKSLAEILTIMAKGTGYKFSRINNNIHIAEVENPKESPIVYEEITLQQLITGKVTSTEAEEPLPGVSILVKGTSTGTTTDFEGNFSLNASQGDILQFSFIGYKSQEIEVGNQTNFNVALETDLEQLEEVVVVGYGTQKKSDLTSAISSIKGEDIAQRVTPRLDEALQGQMAGVSVQQASGVPGAAPRIRVRGINSISAGSSPLFVVYGLPIENSNDYMRNFNMNDVESIEVLKDAASASIYGSREPMELYS